MLYNAQEYARLRNVVLVISLVAWLLLLNPAAAPAACCGGDCLTPLQLLLAAHLPSALVLQLLLAQSPPSAMASDWALMLLAMMTPMLVQPIYHIHISSFVRRRARSTALFVAGYGGMWLTAGGILLTLALTANVLAPQSYLPALWLGLVALVWQASPLKQRFLNRCHRYRPLAAFGAAADWDALLMGVEQGRWCICSCWAAMLFPLLLPHGHFMAMAFVSILMFCERLDPPRTPAWRWRGFAMASRYLSLRLRSITYGL